MSRRKAFPIHLFDPEVVHQVDVEVERLFRGMPRKYGTNCMNPVTDAGYVAGLDPIKPQKEKARNALLGREHFRLLWSRLTLRRFPFRTPNAKTLEGRSLRPHDPCMVRPLLGL